MRVHRAGRDAVGHRLLRGRAVAAGGAAAALGPAVGAAGAAVAAATAGDAAARVVGRALGAVRLRLWLPQAADPLLVI